MNAISSAAPALIQVPTSMPVSAASMAAHSKPGAVLLDALGTLLTFEPPAPHLRAALRERTGVDVGQDAARAAIRAEIAYYRAHLDEGPRPRVAARPARALRRGDGACRFPTAVVLDALLASLRFSRLSRQRARVARAARRRDPHRRRLQLGLVAARAAGRDRARAARRRRARLRRGRLGQARRRDLRARRWSSRAPTRRSRWHVGDTPEADVEGARAAGLRPILIARDGPGAALEGVLTVRSLAELIPLATP